MKQLAANITHWICEYVTTNRIQSLVVGISGGIDSSVVSTLSARTGLPVTVVTMPIHQRPEQHDLSLRHGAWLTECFANVTHVTKDLTAVFDQFKLVAGTYDNMLGMANSRARLRMACLYQIAQHTHGIVVGTGNRVEDFGVGFYTKYGDGGVDISPIGDLVKTEVWELGRELGILEDIIHAAPTDGLWADGRTDQAQLGGLTYEQLELAMSQDQGQALVKNAPELGRLQAYQALRSKNLHKMTPIPVFKKSAG
jgi:NAD+ synthase